MNEQTKTKTIEREIQHKQNDTTTQQTNKEMK